jgi:multidrug resistance efflux pump
VTSTPVQVHVEPASLALTLGERVSVEVEVFNGSAIVDEFRVSLLGPWVDPIRPEWVTIQPASIALFPNTSGVVLVTLDVPAASQLLAGAHTLGIRVFSTTDPAVAYVAEVPVTVNSQPLVSLHLDPQNVSGGSRVETQIVARNLGNVAVNLWFETSDPANAIQASLARTEIALPPDDEVGVPMTLQARRPLIGSGTARPFAVTAEVEDRAGEVGAEAQPYIEAVRADGVFQQSARINGRVLTSIGMLLPVIAIIVAALILRPAVEAEVLSGPLSFGVGGEVERLEVRRNEFVLAGHRIATLGSTEAELALSAAQLRLRRAIVDLEGLKTQYLADQAQAALDQDTAEPAPDTGFLATLVQELQAAVESALSVSSTALTGLTRALNGYCATATERPVECDTQPVPLPAAFIAALVEQSATNPRAREVVDANANYRSASATLQTVQRLLQESEARLIASGGDPNALGEANGELTAIALAQSEQAQTEFELSLLEQQAVIAQAQLECRAYLQDVGRTVLRAPVDLQIMEVLVTPGAEVGPDDPIVIVERTDGRVFTPPAGLRRPHAQDLPDESCPGTIEELRTSDTTDGTATPGTPGEVGKDD